MGLEEEGRQLQESTGCGEGGGAALQLPVHVTEIPQRAEDES